MLGSGAMLLLIFTMWFGVSAVAKLKPRRAPHRRKQRLPAGAASRIALGEPRRFGPFARKHTATPNVQEPTSHCWIGGNPRHLRPGHGSPLRAKGNA